MSSLVTSIIIALGVLAAGALVVGVDIAADSIRDWMEERRARRMQEALRRRSPR